jgi:murein DD-endopeptidase MepM/ murein hydrolase activator NlpD
MQREREYMSIIYPIKGDLDKQFKITSPFGTRKHPITGKISNHNGLDLVKRSGKSEGEPIIAPETGKVLEARKSTAPGGGYGYFVKLQGKSGTVHLLAHMIPNSLKVKKGWVVEQGDVLGLLGTSGASTGPHVHWETRVKGKFVDPLTMVGSTGKPKLPKDFKAWTKNNENGTVSAHIKNAPRGSKVRVRHNGVSVFNQTVRLASHAGLGKTIKLNLGRNVVSIEVDGHEVKSATYNFKGVNKPKSKPVHAEPASGEKFHIVKAGDNLTKIAKQYGTTVPALKKINGITNANLIKVGQLIKLP